MDVIVVGYTNNTPRSLSLTVEWQGIDLELQANMYVINVRLYCPANMHLPANENQDFLAAINIKFDLYGVI